MENYRWLKHQQRKKGFGKEDPTKKLGVKQAATKRSSRPAKTATKVAQATVAYSPSEERIRGWVWRRHRF